MVYCVFSLESPHRKLRFLASKTHEIYVNTSITVKVLGGISFHVVVENWQHLKGTLAFSSFLCVRIEIESC